MQYRDHEIPYDSDKDDLEAEALRQQNEIKRYSKKRVAKPRPRRVIKSVEQGYGFARRRIHRTTW